MKCRARFARSSASRLQWPPSSGRRLRGPVDAAQHITSWADFDRSYGALSGTSLMSYAVFHYFLNGGSEAEIVRVTARDAAATITRPPGVELEAATRGAGNDLRARVDANPADRSCTS